MVKVHINQFNYKEYNNYYFKLIIDNKNFYIKMQGNWYNLNKLVLFRPDWDKDTITCIADFYPSNYTKFLLDNNNPISESGEMTLYKKSETKDGVIIDKIFDCPDFKKIFEITADNFIEKCFHNRTERNTEIKYLRDDYFANRPSKDEIVVNLGNKYYKKVHIDKQDREYINSGNIDWSVRRLYLTKEQEFKG